MGQDMVSEGSGVAAAATAAAHVSELMIASRTFRTLPERTLALRHRIRGAPTAPAVDPSVWRLHVSFHVRHDSADLEGLVDYYSSHARTLARRMHREREPLDDLVQVSNEALVLALERFDPDRRKPFLGYANPTIVGTLKRYYRDAGWAMRVPRRVHSLTRPVREAHDLLSQDLGRRPSATEIADFLDVDLDDVEEAMAAHAARSTRSLNAVTSESGPLIEERLGTDDAGIARVELRQALRQTLHRLPEEDQKLIDMYFVQELRQTDIAEVLGCSQMQVSRSLRRALRQLRAYMRDEPID